jgi:hypothetical protein
MKVHLYLPFPNVLPISRNPVVGERVLRIMKAQRFVDTDQHVQATFEPVFELGVPRPRVVEALRP